MMKVFHLNLKRELNTSKNKVNKKNSYCTIACISGQPNGCPHFLTIGNFYNHTQIVNIL